MDCRELAGGHLWVLASREHGLLRAVSRENLWQITVSSALGFAFGAARLATGTILPLIVLHGYKDWDQLITPEPTPFWLQVAVVVIQITWGIVLLHGFIQDRRHARASGDALPGDRHASPNP